MLLFLFSHLDLFFLVLLLLLLYHRLFSLFLIPPNSLDYLKTSSIVKLRLSCCFCILLLLLILQLYAFQSVLSILFLHYFSPLFAILYVLLVFFLIAEFLRLLLLYLLLFLVCYILRLVLYWLYTFLPSSIEISQAFFHVVPIASLYHNQYFHLTLLLHLIFRFYFSYYHLLDLCSYPNLFC